VLIQNSAKAIGFTIDILQQSSTQYYGDFTFGGSPWLTFRRWASRTTAIAACPT
jgi:hypothetical protein